MTNTENNNQPVELYAELDRLSVKYNTSIADVLWAVVDCEDSEDETARALSDEARQAIEASEGPISDSLIEDLIEEYAPEDDELYDSAMIDPSPEELGL